MQNTMQLNHNNIVDTIKQSVYKQLMIPISIAFITLIAIFLAFTTITQKNKIHEHTKHVYETVSSNFDMLLKTQAHSLASIEELIIQDPELIKLLQTQDETQILIKYKNIFNELKNKYKITHFYFHKPNRVNLIRIHHPLKNGDLINRFTAIQSEKIQKLSYGIELGPLGTFTLRAVSPIYNNNNTLIGYIELGKEIEDIFETIKKQYNVDLVATIHKKYLSRSAWEQGMKMLEREYSWKLFSKVTMLYSTLSPFPQEFNKCIEGEPGHDTSHEKENTPIKVKYNGENFNITSKTLKDAFNRDVGQLLVILNTTKDTTTFKKNLSIILVFIALLTSILIVFLHITIKNIDKNINRYQSSLKELNKRTQAVNQQLMASEQQLKSINQQLLANEQQLKSTNQQLQAKEQQLTAQNKQLLEQEKNLKNSEEGLKTKITDLDKINKIMMNREFRIIDLKKEINQLYEELGKPIKYTKGLSS